MNVTLEKDGELAILTLDRPDKLNAMADPMWDALHAHLGALAQDESVRAMILTGVGRAFCSGGDVGGMARSDIVSGRARSQRRHRAITALYQLEKPVVAAVRGAVYGIGNALALACDLVIASETARFSMAFKNVGLVPDGGAIFLLARQLGIARAKELVYTARPVAAAEALDLGLATSVVPDERLEAEARAVALELAQSPTHALALAKKMFHAMAVPTLEMLLEMETLASGVARLTHDHKEGVAAFKNKRPPRFLGR
ncbi:MAG: enoyl-CoA hydratase-related protein [Betaproteobacteria bacterium]|nr:enoyl-CoA hydratase-related protein [Betaproteobacteria bacterium]MDH3437018.1 enoyl-CoA hydratase-related protein [Betaproteobacteria bacterium]